MSEESRKLKCFFWYSQYQYSIPSQTTKEKKRSQLFYKTKPKHFIMGKTLVLAGSPHLTLVKGIGFVADWRFLPVEIQMIIQEFAIGLHTKKLYDMIQDRERFQNATYTGYALYMLKLPNVRRGTDLVVKVSASRDTLTINGTRKKIHTYDWDGGGETIWDRRQGDGRVCARSIWAHIMLDYFYATKSPYLEKLHGVCSSEREARCLKKLDTMPRSLMWKLIPSVNKSILL